MYAKKEILVHESLLFSFEICWTTYTCSPNRNNPNKYHSMPDDTDEYSRADYFNDPYNSRDLNPTEPMDHGCGSRRE
jgi:hypothetical protein